MIRGSEESMAYAKKRMEQKRVQDAKLALNSSRTFFIVVASLNIALGILILFFNLFLLEAWVVGLISLLGGGLMLGMAIVAPSYPVGAFTIGLVTYGMIGLVDFAFAFSPALVLMSFAGKVLGFGVLGYGRKSAVRYKKLVLDRVEETI